MPLTTHPAPSQPLSGGAGLVLARPRDPAAIVLGICFPDILSRLVREGQHPVAARHRLGRVRLWRRLKPDGDLNPVGPAGGRFARVGLARQGLVFDIVIAALIDVVHPTAGEVMSEGRAKAWDRDRPSGYGPDPDDERVAGPVSGK